MRLSDDEQQLAEYYFKDGNDVANMSVLTNRRLVVVYGNAEESYPLSKITAVKILFKRSMVMLIIGSLVALIGLATLGSNLIVALVFLAAGGALAYFGWKGKTILAISQMGGAKDYVLRGQDSRLADFMHAVNGKLS